MKKAKSWQLGLMAVPFVLSVLIIAWVYWPQKSYSLNKVFFTVDDGAHWYADDVNLIPPCDHEGKTAVRAVIYSYSAGSKTFCGYLMRYPASVRKSILDSAAASGGKQTPYSVATSIAFSGASEVKAPGGAGTWVNINSPQAQTILQVKAPDGSELDQVLP